MAPVPASGQAQHCWCGSPSTDDGECVKEWWGVCGRVVGSVLKSGGEGVEEWWGVC